MLRCMSIKCPIGRAVLAGTAFEILLNEEKLLDQPKLTTNSKSALFPGICASQPRTLFPKAVMAGFSVSDESLSTGVGDKDSTNTSLHRAIRTAVEIED